MCSVLLLEGFLGFLVLFWVFLLLLVVWGFGGVLYFSRIRNLMVVGIGRKRCTLGKTEHAHLRAFVPTLVSAASRVRESLLCLKKVTQNPLL